MYLHICIYTQCVLYIYICSINQLYAGAAHFWSHAVVTCGTWLILARDTTHRRVCHDSLLCAPWLIHVCHDSLMYATRLNDMCDMTHLWHDLLICRFCSFLERCHGGASFANFLCTGIRTRVWFSSFVRDVTHLNFLWHDLIVRDVTYLNLFWHDSFYAGFFLSAFVGWVSRTLRVQVFECVRGMTRLCLTWFIWILCDMTHLVRWVSQAFRA